MLAVIRKALVPLVIAGYAVGVQWAITRQFTLSAEFVTAALGVASALIVYYVPNALSSPGLAPVRKALVPLAAAAVAVIVQWSTTGSLSWSQEFLTALQGLGTGVFVYWVPNLLMQPAPIPAARS